MVIRWFGSQKAQDVQFLCAYSYLMTIVSIHDKLSANIRSTVTVFYIKPQFYMYYVQKAHRITEVYVLFLDERHYGWVVQTCFVSQKAQKLSIVSANSVMTLS